MVHRDVVTGFGDEVRAPVGHRRATYTPPVATSAAAEPPVAEGFMPPNVSASEHVEVPVPSAAHVVPLATVDTDDGGSWPTPPLRRSLDDAELNRSIDGCLRERGATLGAIDKLESELLLRENEATEFLRWQATMISIGSPEALSCLHGTREIFTGVLDSSTKQLSTPQPAPPQKPAEPRKSGSTTLIDDASTTEDPIDVTDRAGNEVPSSRSSAPVQEFAIPRVPTGEIFRASSRATAGSAAVVESSGTEPTPLDRRIGRAARMFWFWFATNSSVLSLAFGGALFTLGMSLRQAVLAAFIGVALSFLPLGLGTLAGKWSGQPTMVASRATFGVVGNVAPALLAVITRVFWGAVLLWLLARSTARIVVGAGLNGALSELQLTLIAVALGFFAALAVAIFGYGLFARVQVVLSIVAAVLVIGLMVITWPYVNISRALTVGDGPWILVVSGVVLVFSFVGLVWVSSTGDLARYQRPASSGAATMLWASLGATLPAFFLIAYGALLAASNPRLAIGLTTGPIDTIALMMPDWYPVPLIAATSLSLLAGIVLSTYSGGFALQATGLRVHRGWSTVIVGIILFGVAVVLSFSVDSVVPVFRDLATTLAVPVAAWAGIFSADMMIRRRGFDSISLLRRGGVYPDVNWLNVSMLVVVSAVGYGLTTATIGWLGWEGYIFSLLGVPLQSDLARTDIGVVVAFVLALAITLSTAAPTARKQERRHPVAF